jgi:acyl carrier protein
MEESYQSEIWMSNGLTPGPGILKIKFEKKRSKEAKMSDVFKDVQAIIVEQLGVEEDKVVLESRFREDLEADSLDIVELIMAFEDKFGGEISDEDAQNITTVEDVVNYIESEM